MPEYALPSTRVPPTKSNGLPWCPGVTYNGGIPNRTDVNSITSPSGLTDGTDGNNVHNAIAACPENSGKVVAMSAGTFYFNTGTPQLRRNGITVRGAGPGLGWGLGTGTFIRSNAVGSGFRIGNDEKYDDGPHYNLVSTASRGATSVIINVGTSGISVNTLVIISMQSIPGADHPLVWWNGNHDAYNPSPPPTYTRSYFTRDDRPLGQILWVTGVANNTPSAGQSTITFEEGLNLDYDTAYSPQISMMGSGGNPLITWSGIEELYVYGVLGGGGFSIRHSAYCWLKHVEADFCKHASGPTASYRCELRDSFFHETPERIFGGGGYMTGISDYSGSHLFENNIMWNCNKSNVVQGGCTNNVIGYCYQDDQMGDTYPHLGESGLNFSHEATPHFNLGEGNYTPNITAESFWGNCIFNTFLRNHCSALRAGARGLSSYTVITSIGVTPYIDMFNRYGVVIHKGCYGHNFIGNVLGLQNQVLLHEHTYQNWDQVAWQYEAISAKPADGIVAFWWIGKYDDNSQSPTERWDATVVSGEGTPAYGQLRDGNWTWEDHLGNGSLRWHGIGGSGAGGVAPANNIMPQSLYIATGKPAFFYGAVWPWVEAAGGTKTYVLPAKARFDAGLPNDLSFTGGGGPPAVTLRYRKA